jgi:excisionase family DNA binding protein
LSLSDLLRDLPNAAREATPEDLPALLGKLAEVGVVVLVRLAQASPRVTAKESTDGDRLVSLPEVAGILGVPEDRAYDLARRGELPVVRIGKYKRVRMSALTAFIGANEERAR